MKLERIECEMQLIYGNCDKCHERLKLVKTVRRLIRSDYFKYECPKCGDTYNYHLKFPHLAYCEKKVPV